MNYYTHLSSEEIYRIMLEKVGHGCLREKETKPFIGSVSMSDFTVRLVSWNQRAPIPRIVGRVLDVRNESAIELKACAGKLYAINYGVIGLLGTLYTISCINEHNWESAGVIYVGLAFMLIMFHVLMKSYRNRSVKLLESLLKLEKSNHH